MADNTIKTLFLDIGGVLLTNGWESDAREKAIAHFNLNAAEFNNRHSMTFDTYEEGKITLSTYLKSVVFHKARSFSEIDFTNFMFEQSHSYPDTIAFFKTLKINHQLKVFTISNEGRELNAYRIKTFKLNEVFDAYISSAFVFMRKPDPAMFLMALDISQTAPDQSLYIDDRPLFVEVAKSLGLHAIHYQDLETAKKQLNAFGLGLTEINNSLQTNHLQDGSDL